MDEEFARARFSGKTKDEAKTLIKEDLFSASEDLAWMAPEMFSFYIHSVLEIADEELCEFSEESCDVLDNIVSMMKMRHILNGSGKQEPLESIVGLLAKCKGFCERVMQEPAFHQKSKQEQRLIISPLKKIEMLEAQYKIRNVT